MPGYHGAPWVGFASDVLALPLVVVFGIRWRHGHGLPCLPCENCGLVSRPHRIALHPWVDAFVAAVMCALIVWYGAGSTESLWGAVLIALIAWIEPFRTRTECPGCHVPWKSRILIE